MQIRGVAAVSGALVLCSLVGVAPAALSAEASESPDVYAAVRFREALGLNAEQSYVASLETDPGASRKYGLALTAAEEADLDERGRIQAELGSAVRFLDGIPDRSGGLFIDQRAGGVIVVNLVAGTEDDKALLASLLPAGASFEFRAVSSTLVDLKALHARVDAATPDFRAAGIREAGPRRHRQCFRRLWRPLVPSLACSGVRDPVQR
jgi:hypothetical protein